MANAGNTGRNSTLGPALMLVLLVAAIAAIAVYVALNPWILENILYIVFIAALAFVVIVGVIYAAMVILAVPYYAAKGESYQTDASYDLDDVKPVKEKDSEKTGPR
ncbi:MAG: hypothetical protein LBP82_04475 [Candidatus Methanoplasma sp.]|jgi:hypothetical protein|nr:hypothetical protein [Candidatus Methanoplasma sp.]